MAVPLEHLALGIWGVIFGQCGLTPKVEMDKIFQFFFKIHKITIKSKHIKVKLFKKTQIIILFPKVCLIFVISDIIVLDSAWKKKSH